MTDTNPSPLGDRSSASCGLEAERWLLTISFHCAMKTRVSGWNAYQANQKANTEWVCGNAIGSGLIGRDGQCDHVSGSTIQPVEPLISLKSSHALGDTQAASPFRQRDRAQTRLRTAG